MDRGSDSDETFAQAMVCVSVANLLPSKEFFDPFAGLWSAIVQTIEGRDLDAHIAVLILKSSRTCTEPILELLSRLLAESLCCGQSRFSTEIAKRGTDLFRASVSKASSITPEDCVLLCWLANRL